MKNDLAVLNVLAANKWKRPIYFTAPFRDLGFSQYLRSDGMSYRLVPVQPKDDSNVNTDVAYQNIKEKFSFGNAQTPGVYFDEENRRHLLSIRSAVATVADNLADNGKKEQARELLDKVDKGMDKSNMPDALVSRSNQHNIVSISLMEAAFKAEHTEMAERLLKNVKKDLDEQMIYYASLGKMSVNELIQHMQDPEALNNFQRGLYNEIDQTLRVQNYLNFLESKYKPVTASGNTEAPATIQTTGPDSNQQAAGAGGQ